MIKGSTKVGEVFVCNEETNGKLEVMPQFLGKAIIGFGGGYDKMFVLEEDGVSPLHPPEKDLDRRFYEQDQDDNPGEVKEQKVMEFDEEYQEHQESEIANQEEMYMQEAQMQEAQMNEAQMQMDQEEYYADQYAQMEDEYQQNEHETKMYRTRGSGRSQTGPNDERARTPGVGLEMGNTRMIQENMGHLKEIAGSKNHILQLTRDGFVYSYGSAGAITDQHFTSSDKMKGPLADFPVSGH